MNRMSLLGGAALLLVGVGVPAQPASASPATPALAVPAGADALLPALQRDLGWGPADARARLAAERSAPTTAAGLRARLGPSYGGSWLTADGRLVVATTYDTGQRSPSCSATGLSGR
jgi:streptogrisin C